ncbi:amino acid-binding protein [Methanogenium organophilum]|uniref:Amino acid-binding protein n=2 Tax=Methanogenium organophilum TaxID=2199 RepID=A0A9X9S3U9_METOG|nr:amino acid-binding protein [Methanogenium organophilum]
MKLEMKDSPGQLVAALKPISDMGGNILSVIHERDPEADGGLLDVQIMCEISEGTLDTLLSQYRSQGISVLRVGEERFLVRRSIILIGHLIHTDISDTIDKIDSTGYAEVHELSMVMPAINEPSSAKMTIKSDCITDVNRALAILRDVAREKELLIIESLEGN